jgi:hypothetical protein
LKRNKPAIKNEEKEMKTCCIIMQIVFNSFIADSSSFATNCCKSDESYMLQEVVLGSWYVPVSGYFRLKTEGGIFYLAKEKDIVEYIKADSVKVNELTLIVEPRKEWRYINAKGQYINDPSYSSGLEYIFLLDNTEIYIIGGRYYAIRKIKYSYCDEIDLHKTKYQLRTENTSEIHYNDQDSIDKITNINFRDYYNVNYFRYFLFLEEFLPTDKSILKYVWKKKYELPYFWKEESPLRILPYEMSKWQGRGYPVQV